MLDRVEREDADAVARALQGDPEAYRALVERHGGRVFRIAFRITGSEADAEDVVQETFLKTYSRLSRFQPDAGFGAWIGRIATNAAIDVLRSRRRRSRILVEGADDPEARVPEPVDAEPLPDRAAYGTELGGKVQQALDRLSEKERAAFILRHFEEHSIKEIAAALSQSESATKQALFRAVRKLRTALAPELAGRRMP